MRVYVNLQTSWLTISLMHGLKKKVTYNYFMFIPDPKKPKTCLASARVSTQKQTGGESLKDQVSEIERFAKDINLKILPDGVVDVEVFTGSKRRPVYEKHIEYIKNNPGKVGYYIIRYIDRFTRGGVGPYKEMKMELAELGVELIDTYGVIQPAKNLPELEELGFEYEWSKRSNSEMTEAMMAIKGEEEKLDILRRTIPKQIGYTQKGFQIGRPDDGFVNEKIAHGGMLRCIQVPDPKRAHFFIKIFELRAQNKYTDKEIVYILNQEMDFRTKTFNRWDKSQTEVIGKGGRKKLTVKQMQRIIQRVSYAGFICEKWTYNQIIKAKWDGLVSIETFNKANRGKVFIEEKGLDYQILYDYQVEKKQPKRMRYNPEFPFKCFHCDICGTPMLGSFSRGRNGTRYPKYHCARDHKQFSIPREELHHRLDTFLKEINYSPVYLEILEAVLVKKFREKQAAAVKHSKTINEAIVSLKQEQEDTLKAFVGSTAKSTKELLEKRLEALGKNIQEKETQRFTTGLKEDRIKDLIKYTRKIVETPEKTLIDKENPLRQEKLLGLLFDKMPTYSELVSRNTQLSFVFNTLGGIRTLQNTEESQLG